MINMLRNHRVIGHALNVPELKINEKKKSSAKIYLRVREMRRFKGEDNEIIYKPYYTTIPLSLFGKTAEYAHQYIVRGQKILVEFAIDSVMTKHSDQRQIVLVATAVQTLEKSDVAEKRMEAFEKEKEQKLQAKAQSEKETNEVEDDDKSFDNINLQYISEDEEEFPFD